MNIYETDNLVSQYCEFHYGEAYFGVKNFPQTSVHALQPFLHKIQPNKVLDLGCAVGRSSFELAQYFDHVTAIDYSHKFIDVAKQLQNDNTLQYRITTEGSLYETKEINLKQLKLDHNKTSIDFQQGDALNLDPSITNYDLIFCSNLIDRLYDPKTFLQQIQHKLNTNALLVILSPYTWLEEYTKPTHWLGGYTQNDRAYYTLDQMKQKLDKLTLIHTQDVEFVIRETARKFQHTISQMSIWAT